MKICVSFSRNWQLNFIYVKGRIILDNCLSLCDLFFFKNNPEIDTSFLVSRVISQWERFRNGRFWNVFEMFLKRFCTDHNFAKFLFSVTRHHDAEIKILISDFVWNNYNHKFCPDKLVATYFIEDVTFKIVVKKSKYWPPKWQSQIHFQLNLSSWRLYVTLFSK